MSTNKVNAKQTPDVIKPNNVEASSVSNSNEPINLFMEEEPDQRAICNDSGIFIFNEDMGANTELTSKDIDANRYLGGDIPELDSVIRERYSPGILKVFNGLNSEQLKSLKHLAKTRLIAEDAADIAKKFNESDVKKITSHLLEMQKTCSENNLKEITFKPDSYDPSAYLINLTQIDEVAERNELLDKNMNRQAYDEAIEYKTADGRYFGEKKSHDLRTNTYTYIRYGCNSDEKKSYVTHEIRSTLDKDGKVKSRVYLRPSQVKGIYDIDKMDENGKIEPVSRGVLDPKTGAVGVKKTMTSLDGTKTFYSYADTPNGDRTLTYKITDKDGKVLMDNTKTFHVISDNHYTSTSNGKSYDITVGDYSLTVKDMADSKRTATFNFHELEDDIFAKMKNLEKMKNPEKIKKQVLSDSYDNKEKILEALKQLPGDELLALKETTKILKGRENAMDSVYTPSDKSLYSGNKLFSILHELGHAKDSKNFTASTLVDDFNKGFGTVVTNDNEFKKIYKEEREAFKSAFPTTQRQYIDYFINGYQDSIYGRKETVAESNALLNTPTPLDTLEMRTQYLQQYFPRTIARANELLQADGQ